MFPYFHTHTHGLLEKQWNLVYCVSYGIKRDKEIVLSSGMINTLEVNNGNLSFLQQLLFIFLCAFIYTSFSRSFNYEHWRMNDENWVMNKPEIFSLIGVNCHMYFKCFSKCMKIMPCCTCLFEWHKRFKKKHEEVKDDFRSGRPSTSRTDINFKQVRQVVSDNQWLTEWLQVSRTWKRTVFGRLSLKIWACRKSAQKLCQNCWNILRGVLVV